MRDGSTGDEDEDDGFEILTPLPAPGRSLEDSLSFSELQAQQIAFAQLHRQANRRKARAHESPSRAQGPATKGKAAAKSRPSPRGRSPRTASSPSPSSSSSFASSPRSDSRVLRKTALASPFEDAPRRNVSASNGNASKTKTTRERRAPPSFSDFQAQEQVYSRLKAEWKKSAANADDSPIPAGYPEQSSDTDVLDDDDDFVSGPEKTTDDTSDDDDFFAPEPKKSKAKTSTDAAKQTAPSRDQRYTKKAAKPKTKKRYAKSGHKSLVKANGGGNGVPTAAAELVTDTLAHPRDATSTVIHCSSWRGVYFGEAPVSVLPMDESVDAEFHSEFERPLATYGEWVSGAEGLCIESVNRSDPPRSSAFRRDGCARREGEAAFVVRPGEATGSDY